MKRKNSSNTDSIKKKRTTTESSYDESVKEIVERKRRENFEIVSEENKINRTPQKCAIALADTSKDDQEDYDIADSKKFKLFLQKEKRRTVEEYHVVPREKLKSALDILKTPTKNASKTLSNEEKRLNLLKKHCSKDYSNISQENEPDHTWDSPMYILKNIRACILTRNWDNVTNLLLMLFKYRKAYIPFTKQVTLLNLLCNPEDYNGEILEEFFEMMAKPD